MLRPCGKSCRVHLPRRSDRGTGSAGQRLCGRQRTRSMHYLDAKNRANGLARRPGVDLDREAASFATAAEMARAAVPGVPALEAGEDAGPTVGGSGLGSADVECWPRDRTSSRSELSSAPGGMDREEVRAMREWFHVASAVEADQSRTAVSSRLAHAAGTGCHRQRGAGRPRGRCGPRCLRRPGCAPVRGGCHAFREGRVGGHERHGSGGAAARHRHRSQRGRERCDRLLRLRAAWRPSRPRHGWPMTVPTGLATGSPERTARWRSPMGRFVDGRSRASRPRSWMLSMSARGSRCSRRSEQRRRHHATGNGA